VDVPVDQPQADGGRHDDDVADQERRDRDGQDQKIVGTAAISSASDPSPA
jgi:hypothetical protein